jgi:hypothetical protein
MHGPKQKSGVSSYFSNQAPRTYGPKPRYAVKFWRERGHKAPMVDVLGVIRTRAQRAYSATLKPVRSRVQLADSRTVNWPSLLGDLGRINYIVTSPPYYGLCTYRPDQWLREWFLGGSEDVSYTADTQVTHASPEKFAADLAKVWNRLADQAASDARMIVRFGAINDRPVDPVSIIRQSLQQTPWRVVHMRDAGLSSSGRRQASSFNEDVSPALEEVDISCRL